MPLKVSARSRDLPPFYVMEVMRAANAREAAQQAVYHMEVGQPGTSAPEGALRAAEAALRSHRLGYTEALGLPELRQAIAQHYKDYYGADLDADRVVVTMGSSGAFVQAFLAAFDVGDRVAIASPGYPCYRTILAALGVEAVLLETEIEHGFQPTPDLLDQALREGPLDGLIVASPANPTGSMLSDRDLEALSSYCDLHGIRLVSDEIYHGVTYTAKAASALSYSSNAIVINSFSKYFSMTGWRLGWMIAPEDLTQVCEYLGQNLFISPPTLSQFAAMAAFDCKVELDANVARYAQNRALLLAELPKIGFDKLAPADGAFYLYADVSRLTNDSQEFCARMLAETGVAATPGLDFDAVRGHRFMRFSFAGATGDMAAAVEALRVWNR
jgi:aspartate/methionine/tyrosine aminotransferase